jgi:hypothetical protein
MSSPNALTSRRTNRFLVISTIVLSYLSLSAAAADGHVRESTPLGRAVQYKPYAAAAAAAAYNTLGRRDGEGYDDPRVKGGSMLTVSF